MQQSLDSSPMAGQNMTFPFACGLNAYKPDSTKNRLVLICTLDYQNIIVLLQRLMVPKCDIFDHLSSNDFYTIKPL